MLRLAAIGMDIYDLRGWGQSLTYYGNPALVNTDLSLNPPPVASPYGWRVGGAITDGASICLLRVVRENAPEFQPIDAMTIEIVKPLPGAGAGGVPLSTRTGGHLYAASADLLPPLPIAEDFPGGHGNRVMIMTAGRGLYVPPESYLDPRHTPGAAGHTLNSGELCVVAFRASLDGEYIPGGRSFILRRPPIVLVHGIMSGPETWSAAAYNELPGKPVKTRLYYADYSSTATKGYSENFHVLPETIAAALNDYRTANDGDHDPSRGFRGIRYAATRADVVGHSMGGQLARTFISNLDWSDLGAINRTRNGAPTVWPAAAFLRTGTFGDRRYIRPDNWGAGDIRRLVTIGSPFKGSPIANALEQWLEPTEDIFLGLLNNPWNGAGDGAGRAVGWWGRSSL